MLLGAGAVVVVVALVVTAAVVVPRMLGGSSSENAFAIADLSEDMERDWEFDFALGDSGYEYAAPSVWSVGEDEAVVMTRLESLGGLAGEVDSSWYAGIEADYQAGWDAYDEWQATDPGFSSPGSEWWAENQEGLTDSYGYNQGWSDNQYGSFGDNLPEEPDLPSSQPTLTKLNLRNGEAQWEINLEDALEGFHAPTHGLYGGMAGFVTGEQNAVILRWGGDDVDENNNRTYHLAAVSTDSGEVLSQAAVDFYPELYAYSEGVVLMRQSSYPGESEPDSRSVAEYRNAASLDEAAWVSELELEGFGDGVILTDGPDGDILRLTGWSGNSGSDAENYYISLEDGAELEEFARLGQRWIVTVDGEYVEVSSRGDGIELLGVDAALDETWDDVVEARSYTVVHDALYIADGSGDRRDVMRINPATGDEMWDRTARESFSYIHEASDGDYVYLIGDDALTVLDAADGAEVFSLGRLEGTPRVHPGDSRLYTVSDREITAYEWNGERDWRWRYGGSEEGETVIRAGQHLLLVDAERQTLYGLD
ncbi:outer membrane protein assembly factor BamB family protein [Nesterenkonia flava]|uniref:PQQ-binding-like beta-propeller repeat protein n=1 Tax=Nesterenkonia flava TaxID=469799 RepID=A0ABU1FQA2_9MICC|nr:PQQ-binding-like beta-propeller repeat protein [Nesterenkonia flava]MDR5710830.1 PQQ-binding-like beta-propeller repeat protein [Nesterenkonia flava]